MNYSVVNDKIYVSVQPGVSVCVGRDDPLTREKTRNMTGGDACREYNRQTDAERRGWETNAWISRHY